MQVSASVRSKGMKRGAEKQIAKMLGFEHADVRDFVAHLELNATSSNELLFLREMQRVIAGGGYIEVCPKGGKISKMSWRDDLVETPQSVGAGGRVR